MWSWLLALLHFLHPIFYGRISVGPSYHFPSFEANLFFTHHQNVFASFRCVLVRILLVSIDVRVWHSIAWQNTIVLVHAKWQRTIVRHCLLLSVCWCNSDIFIRRRCSIGRKFECDFFSVVLCIFTFSWIIVTILVLAVCFLFIQK